MHTNKGFSLIEIMVVLVIIGICLGFALLAFGDFGANRRISLAGEQFVNTLRLAQQQAILESSTLGLRLNNGHYQILRLQPPSHWIPVASKRLFAMQHFPTNTVLQLSIKKQSKKSMPSLIINSSGSLTPFTLKMGTAKQENLLTLTGSHNGQLTLLPCKGS